MQLKELNLDKLPENKPLFRRLSLLEHEQIPKPLHGLNPRTIKGKAWWDRQRQKAYKLNNYCCHACGEPRYHLEAHEVYDILPGQGRMVFIEIVALCADCHRTIHLGLTELQHGALEVDRLLDRRDKLFEKWQYDIAPPRDWSKWCLVFNGKEYKGKFKDEQAWRRHYSGS